MALNDAPIGKKVTAAIMATCAVVLLMSAAVFIIHEVVTFRQTLEENCRTMARVIAAQSSGGVDYENEPDCRKILSKLEGEPLGLAGGPLRQRRQNAGPLSRIRRLSVLPGHPVAKKVVDGRRRGEFFLPVRQDDRVVGVLYLKWDFSAAYRRFRWDAGMLALMLAGPCSWPWSFPRFCNGAFPADS